MTQWAVHSLHSPAVAWNGTSYSVNGKDQIKAGDPIAIAETFMEAEQWRLEQNPIARRPAPTENEGGEA